MKNNISTVPIPTCEPVKSYKKNSTERLEALEIYTKSMHKIIEIPMWIDGKNIKSKKIKNIYPPHNHNHLVGKYYEGNTEHVKQAIKSALNAKKKWEQTSWEDRASIFLKAAELLTGKFRQKMNVATMIGQSKNIFQEKHFLSILIKPIYSTISKTIRL